MKFEFIFYLKYYNKFCWILYKQNFYIILCSFSLSFFFIQKRDSRDNKKNLNRSTVLCIWMSKIRIYILQKFLMEFAGIYWVKFLYESEERVLLKWKIIWAERNNKGI